MRLIPPLAILNHTVKISGYQGTDAYGQTVLADSTLLVDAKVIVSASPGNVIIRGRFEPAKLTTRSPEGEQKEYKAVFFTLGNDIPAQSVITYPLTDGDEYIVQECIRHFDHVGVAYLELVLQ